MRIVNRVKKKEEFQKVINTGKLIRNSLYTIYFVKNQLNLVRIGVSIPTKIGHAVKRNKIKRQIKAIISSYIDLGFSYDIIVIPRKSYQAERFEQNKQLLIELLNAIRS